MSIMIVSEHRTLNNPQHSLPSVRLKCHYVTTPGGSSAMYKLCHPLSSLSVISPRFLTNISQIKVSSAAPPAVLQAISRIPQLGQFSHDTDTLTSRHVGDV